MVKTPIVYRDKPVFGFDLGFDSIKVMQIDPEAKRQPRVLGYGYSEFNPKAMQNGVIVDPEEIAKSAYKLLTKELIGSIDTRRIVSSIPVSKSYNRILTLPIMPEGEIKEAVKLEAEQYIPVSIDDLYIDYQVGEKHDNKMDVLVVAAPSRIIDSYLQLFDLLGLDVSVVETSINASTRLVMHTEATDVPTLIIDFGSISTDISIFDTVLRLTGTVGTGGDQITDAIASKLNISQSQAHTIKTKYGIASSKKQRQIVEAVSPLLDKIVTEVKKMDKFYQDRTVGDKSKKIEQVIILGGGANMPGLSDYLTDKIRIATRTCNPWLNLDFGDLQPPHQLEKTLYATSAGLSLLTPKEISK